MIVTDSIFLVSPAIHDTLHFMPDLLSSTATSSSESAAVNEVQSAALEPPAAKRNRTADSSPEVAEITD